MLTSVCIFVLTDLIFGGFRSAIMRYFLPAYIGSLLSVTHWITTLIENRGFQSQWRRFLGLSLLSILLLLSTRSSFQYLQTDYIWTVKGDDNYIDVAQVLNNYNSAVLFFPRSRFIDLISLSTYLDKNFKIRVFDDTSDIYWPDSAAAVLLYANNQSIVSELKEAGYQLKSIEPGIFVLER